MSSYTMLNVSDETQKQAPLFFRFAATGCETFVFIYMGLAMFTYNQDFSVTGLTLVRLSPIYVGARYSVAAGLAPDPVDVRLRTPRLRGGR